MSARHELPISAEENVAVVDTITKSHTGEVHVAVVAPDRKDEPLVTRKVCCKTIDKCEKCKRVNVGIMELLQYVRLTGCTSPATHRTCTSSVLQRRQCELA